MTQVIELRYKGTCEGGPWHGQRIEAEFPLIPHDEGGYEYVSASSKPNTWLWHPRRNPPMLANRHKRTQRKTCAELKTH